MKFISIPYCKHTITLNSDDSTCRNCLVYYLRYLDTCDYRFRLSLTGSSVIISLTKLVCSRLRITVCLLATRELMHRPRDLYTPTELLFLWLPPEQLIWWVGISPTDIDTLLGVPKFAEEC